MKRIVSLLLALILLAGLLPLGAAAEEPVLELETRTHINPHYANMLSEFDIPDPAANSDGSTYAATKYYTSVKSLGVAVRDAMESRDTSFVVGYKVPLSSDLQAAFDDAYFGSIDIAFEHTGVPTEGDYIRYQYGGSNCSGSVDYDSSYYYIDMTYSVRYYTSSSQEAVMDDAVDNLLDQLNPTGTNYQKIKKVYDWMCTNIEYDWTHYGDYSYLLQWTGYAALVNRTSVCQGYAVLLYRLALEMGVDCRLVPSIDEENHVWNIVSMGNLYYNVDATWDEGTSSTDHNWFLLSDNNFVDHTRDADFRTTSFYNKYPMGKYNYNPATAVKITTQPKSVTVANGETAKVTVKATGNGLTYKWYFKNAGDSSYTYTSSFTGNSYSIKMTKDRDGRKVLCKVYDQYGNMVQSKSATLNMATPLKITSQPKSVTVAPGATAKVTVKATGDGLTYRWYFKNPGDSGYTYTSAFTGNSYSVAMNAARDGRQVLCRVYDKYGNVVQTNAAKLSMEHYVKITSQPKSVTVAKGATAKVTVKATGDGLTYRWYYKNPGASSYTYTSSFTGSSYSITMTAARAGRMVLCRVYDKYGNVVQTNAVTLKMK